MWSVFLNLNAQLRTNEHK